MKFIRSILDPSLGGKIMYPLGYPIFNITGYAGVLSATFSFQWDIKIDSRTRYVIKLLISKMIYYLTIFVIEFGEGRVANSWVD